MPQLILQQTDADSKRAAGSTHLFLLEVGLVALEVVDLDGEGAGVAQEDGLLVTGAVREDRAELDEVALHLHVRLEALSPAQHRHPLTALR